MPDLIERVCRWCCCAANGVAARASSNRRVHPVSVTLKWICRQQNSFAAVACVEGIPVGIGAQGPERAKRGRSAPCPQVALSRADPSEESVAVAAGPGFGDLANQRDQRLRRSHFQHDAFRGIENLANRIGKAHCVTKLTRPVFRLRQLRSVIHLPVSVETYGIEGSANSIVRTTSENGPSAGSTIRLWKACEVASLRWTIFSASSF